MQSCCFHGYFYLCVHAVIRFYLSTVTVNAESVSGSTPGVRVTWSTTIPSECVASVRVNFRPHRRGSAVVTYTTTNTSETEVIQTGLWCATYYYINVVVTGEASNDPTVSSRQVQVLVGGKENCICMRFQ